MSEQHEWQCPKCGKVNYLEDEELPWSEDEWDIECESCGQKATVTGSCTWEFEYKVTINHIEYDVTVDKYSFNDFEDACELLHPE